MTTIEFANTSPEYPFAYNKIPIANGIDEFKIFTDQFPGFTFCPYVADKDADGWDKSTSRVYMNRVLPNFLYVPVNIPRDDFGSLRSFFNFVQSRDDIPAVNITQPHKSSPVLRELYLQDADSTEHVDTIIRNSSGDLQPYDLNSTAFVEWYKADVGTFKDRSIILVGVGGVGEPIAKKLVVEKPASLLLIDPVDKSSFAEQLSLGSGVEVRSNHSLRAIIASGLADSVILINAAGKEGASTDSELWTALSSSPRKGIFVDIRPHLVIDIVDKAKEIGWAAYTGHGMNAHNDYVLLQGIVARIPGAFAPSFGTFQRLVAEAS